MRILEVLFDVGKLPELCRIEGLIGFASHPQTYVNRRSSSGRRESYMGVTIYDDGMESTWAANWLRFVVSRF